MAILVSKFLKCRDSIVSGIQLGAQPCDCDLFFFMSAEKQYSKLRLHALLFFQVFGIHGSVVPYCVMHCCMFLLMDRNSFACCSCTSDIFSANSSPTVVCQFNFALVFCDLQIMLPTFFSCFIVHRGELSFAICNNLVDFFAVKSVQRCYGVFLSIS